MKIGIVIPAYNEQNTITRVVNELKDKGSVIVANDCSKDDTAKLALAAGAQVVTAVSNGGYDATVSLGFKHADLLGCTHVITFDADGQHPAHQISDFIAAFEAGAAVVVGVRPQMQRISETIFDFYYRLRFRVADPLSGMKGYDLKYYRSIGYFDSIQSIGTELLTHYLLMKLPVSQIKIEIKDREDESRFGGTWRANLKILSALMRLRKVR